MIGIGLLTIKPSMAAKELESIKEVTPEIIKDGLAIPLKLETQTFHNQLSL